MNSCLTVIRLCYSNHVYALLAVDAILQEWICSSQNTQQKLSSSTQTLWNAWNSFLWRIAFLFLDLNFVLFAFEFVALSIVFAIFWHFYEWNWNESKTNAYTHAQIELQTPDERNFYEMCISELISRSYYHSSEFV